MFQLSLFSPVNTAKAVNVASVPQRSPFRYPGGKTWLVPYIRAWLLSLPQVPASFVEPFAGGGIVSLTVAAEHLATHITMIEIDRQVAAVWKTILSDDGGGEWLAERILGFQVDRNAVMELVDQEPRSTRDLAFQTIVKNRVYHGGILAAGSAPIKNGENGKGIGSRWYPQTLIRRIMDIVSLRSKITFIEGDGLAYLEQDAEVTNAVYFIDPPYTAGSKGAGRRLYTHHELDHPHLFEVTSRLEGSFLMTYDNDELIMHLGKRHDLQTATVPMKNTHHADMTELLLSRDLSWLEE